MVVSGYGLFAPSVTEAPMVSQGVIGKVLTSNGAEHSAKDEGIEGGRKALSETLIFFLIIKISTYQIGS